MLGTSQRAPGYRFQYQVPPTPSPASTTWTVKPSSRKWCSAYMPETPAPTTTTSNCSARSLIREGWSGTSPDRHRKDQSLVVLTRLRTCDEVLIAPSARYAPALAAILARS